VRSLLATSAVTRVGSSHIGAKSLTKNINT
jgi:hypothetical protein